MESSNRASYDTLTAVYAGSLSKRKLKCASDMCVEASCISTDNADALILLTCSCTSSAEDALVVVSYDGCRRSVNSELILSSCIVFSILYTISLAESLKLAVSAAYAAKAILIVVREDQLESFTSVILDLLCISISYHAVCAWIYAGSDESSCSYYFTYAHSAGTDLIDASQIAQCRYVDAGLVGCIQ